VKSLLTRLFTLPRWVSFPVVLTALIVTAAVSYPGGLTAAYADLRDSGRLNDSLQSSRTTERQLGERLSGLRDRIDYKEELVTALIRGDVTLTGVADEFAALNRDDEQSLMLQRKRYGDLDEAELAAVNVLDYVRSRVGDDSGTPAVLARLRAEFRQRFGHPPPKL
jgi:hypothetical protein